MAIISIDSIFIKNDELFISEYGSFPLSNISDCVLEQSIFGIQGYLSFNLESKKTTIYFQESQNEKMMNLYKEIVSKINS